MKHNFKFYAAMVCSAVALASCSSEAIEETKTAGKQQMTFTAQQETNVSSRTSLDDDLSVLWASDDALSVFDASNNNAFELSSGAETSTAQFSGEAEPADKYYAVYPYQDGATLDASTIKNVEIPATQTATLNSFDPKANIMTAVSTSANNLAFKNVCSYAKITTTAACKKITFTAGAEDKIAGKFNMTVGADGIASATATAGVNAVTLVPSSDDPFDAGTYYIAINAGTMSALKVECEYANKTVYQSINATVSIFTRANIIDLGTTTGWPEATSYQAVDLGLSVKWATMNVGATSPEEYGDYFAWGATKPWYTEGHSQDNPCTNWIAGKTGYDMNNAPYQTRNIGQYEGSITKWTKYLGSTTSSNKAPSATDANALKTVLDPEDDAAHVNWGGDWRMPTDAEMTELRENCYWAWTTDYNGTGVKGYIIYIAKNAADKGKYSYNYTPSETYDISSDNHIFLPAAGYRLDGSFYSGGSKGYYWSSSLYESGPFCARNLYFYSSYVGWNTHQRGDGQSVRPVCP